jgi:two-component system chemotaxis response regulator CheY
MSKRALIVDDSQLARMMIRKYVADLRPEWEMVLANDGEKALSEALGSRFEVMFIDFNMPGLDGIQLIEKLRENEIYAPAALVTANVQSAVREKAENLNVGFVPKPITKEKLADFLKLVSM